MSAPSYGQYWPITARRWDNAKTTRTGEAKEAANALLSYKPRYEQLVARFAEIHPGAEVPWWWVACVHNRESGADFTTQLAQGDPLDESSTHDPKGEGPYRGPDAWERAAIIAMEAQKLQDVRDWRLEKAIFHWEAYNGWGPWGKGLPTAYNWSGTSVYDPPTGPGGKYVADGPKGWSPGTVDKQLGCVAVLKELMKLDPTINPERETPPGVADEPKPSPAPAPAPLPSQEPTTVTQQPTPSPAQSIVQSFDLATIEKYLDGLIGIASSGPLSMFIPAKVKAFLPAVPMVKEIIEAGKQWEAGSHDLAAITGILGELLTDLGGELTAISASLRKPA